MMLDIKTLMLLYLITNVINAGVMAVIWNQNRGRFAGISFWLVGLALQAAGSLLHVLRGLVPDLISMTLSNTIILAGVLIMLMGLERFTGKKGWQVHNYVLLVVFIAVSAYFVVVQPNLAIRDIAIAAMLMIYTFQCCWLLLRRVAPGMRQITRLTGIVFAVYAAFNFARIILNIIFPEQSNDFYKSGAVNALAITCYIGLNLCLTISLVLMVNRRLLADVKAQEEKFTTAFHSSPYAIILTRASDGTIFEVNDGFVNITGYQYAEVIGKTTLDLCLWVREEDRLAAINELAQVREIYGVEYQFRKKTGEVLTGLFSANHITINNEKCILSSIGDITERKRTEEKVKLIAAEWQTTFDSITDLVSIQDKNYKLVRVNKAYADVFQKKPEELAGRHCYEVVHKTSCPIDNCPHEKTLKTKASTTREIFESGLGAYLEVSCSPISDDQGEMEGTIHIAKNITERKQTEEALARSEERYRTILDNMQDSYIELDLAGNFTFVNEATCRNLGYTMEELIGSNFNNIAPGDDEIKAVFKVYNEVYKTGEPHKGFAFKVIRKDGSTGYAETSISLLKNEQGRTIGFCSVGRDVTERKQLQLKLEEMATHDYLTGLPNRVLLLDRFSMAAALAHRNKARLAVMSLDLDKFKSINDTLGHGAGDQVLKAIGMRLTSMIRASDTAARIGGDEFILVMLETNHMEDATAIAQKILNSFTEPLLIDGHQLHLSTSIGIAIYPEDAEDMETLIKKSDAALYYAKGHGRNQFKFFGDGDVRMSGDHKSANLI